MRGKRSFVAVWLFVALLSACGEEGGPRQPSVADSGGRPDGDSCEAIGIDADQGKTGTCLADGQQITVVNKDDTLKLVGLDAKLTSEPRTAKVLASDGYRARASGRYVLIGLRITNRTREPQSTAVPTYELLADDRTYSMDAEADLAAPQGILKQHGKNLEPGLSQAGQLVFDLPNKLSRQIAAGKAGGNLIVGPFSDEQGATGLGYFRLYK